MTPQERKSIWYYTPWYKPWEAISMSLDPLLKLDAVKVMGSSKTFPVKDDSLHSSHINEQNGVSQKVKEKRVKNLWRWVSGLVGGHWWQVEEGTWGLWWLSEVRLRWVWRRHWTWRWLLWWNSNWARLLHQWRNRIPFLLSPVNYDMKLSLVWSFEEDHVLGKSLFSYVLFERRYLASTILADLLSNITCEFTYGIISDKNTQHSFVGKFARNISLET